MSLPQEIEELKLKIKESSKSDSTISQYAKKNNLSTSEISLKVRRTLRGHIAKVYEVDFCKNDPDVIVSASQDGKLIVWNGLTTHKLFVIPLESQWVLSCGISPGGRNVACGGLDNTLYIYQLNEDDSIPTGASHSFKGHEGSLFKVRFFDDNRVISTSGDKSQILWDISVQELVTQFNGHEGDVMCLDINSEGNQYITGSLDRTARLWDIRTGESVLTYSGHEADINSIRYFPNLNAFATGSDDGTIRLYDIRGDRELMVYNQPEDEALRVLSICFSHSGNYLFSACHSYIFITSTLTGEKIGQVDDTDIISFIGVNPNGNALYSSSWNNFIKVYA